MGEWMLICFFTFLKFYHCIFVRDAYCSLQGEISAHRSAQGSISEPPEWQSNVIVRDHQVPLLLKYDM